MRAVTEGVGRAHVSLWLQSTRCALTAALRNGEQCHALDLQPVHSTVNNDAFPSTEQLLL